MADLPLRTYIRWPVLLPCLLLVILGIAVAFTGIAPDTRNFIAGALIGAGAGGAITEFAATFERRASRQQLAMLRQPFFAQCRNAYRMGEFFYDFQDALSRGDSAAYAVKEFAALGEALGIGGTIAQVMDSQTAFDDDEIRERVRVAMVFVSESLPTFFALGLNVVAMRAYRDAVITQAELTDMLSRVSAGLDDAGRYAEDAHLVKAWTRASYWLEEKRVSDNDIEPLVRLFHVYLLLLGGEGGQFGKEFATRQ